MNQESSEGTPEDKRAAATIATSLSGYVMAGALAVLGAEGAVFVFLLDKKIITFAGWFLLLGTFLALVASCYLGGKGVWEIYASGARGDWKTTVQGKFALQLLLALIGVLLFFGTAIAARYAPEKPASPEHRLQS